jgi:hypothetical protein
MEDKNPHYVTPEEANQKLCPMAKPNTTYIDQRCNGPACMAWRWKENFETITSFSNGKYEIFGKEIRDYSTVRGYCGMVRHG